MAYLNRVEGGSGAMFKTTSGEKCEMRTIMAISFLLTILFKDVKQ